ncbi:putative leucine-rich repeat-containing, plant-type, leucine-rich repeat domain, L [Rosa chinensis]|uniref:Putative leucine-rich repeat-containing, plant-type, leucine-rich repeat domain, L n=1 Tax=Rosa chinensis TaxID=74649 RepID=A0A2P6SFB7_ROSCH|nr:receptor-like protein 7 [Rosa chinensis]PRQ57367.1 putative leucine-rich repeat-containing, plant-type, leucine-rich repeat domain, L [Rosa chinensis]
MGLYRCLSTVSNTHMLPKVVIIILLFHVSVAISLRQPADCKDEESSALLQFKESFIIDRSASGYDGAYPKVLSWKQNNSCCSWDGIECDQSTGYVIGLDLSSSCLYGSINSNSTLFRLVNLQSLNLADNNFNYSEIPTTIRNLPKLRYLNLSASVFSGQVPSEVSQLSKLSSLDLSLNLDGVSIDGLLTLNPSYLASLVHNLTRLENLYLGYINISSKIPQSMANLSFLTSLSLRNCQLFGEFPVRIFQLQNLKLLSVRNNPDLTGYLPEFNQSSPLSSLVLAGTRFSENLPSSIQKLDSLEELNVGGCNFSEGLVPSFLGKLRQLTYLDISKNNYGGPIPDSLANLTQLTVFRIGTSHLTGPIPSWLGNFSKLIYLDFSYNRLNGSIPQTFSNLINLEILYLQYNDLSGTVEFQMFENLQNLYQLHLNGNNLQFLTESTIVNASVPQFTILGLSSCNIREFPSFLRYQQNLQKLYLAENKLYGQVPKWMWNMSIDTLMYLDIDQNFLTGFEQPPVVLPWVNLRFLKLSSNMFHGPLPIPPPSILGYEIQDNKLKGEVSPEICNLSSIQALDLSNNNLSGVLPHCIGNFSDRLILLLLANNSFQGILPQTYSKKSNLRMIDVSYNQLQGQLPRSLANCVMLETLILSDNKFQDVFPSWLVTLPELKVLAMRHNGFHGVIGKPENNNGFLNLRILDLSFNNFRGEFLSEYIFSEYAMRSNITVNQSTYMKTNITYDAGGGAITLDYGYTITIANKGADRYYSKIQEAFAAIDVSSNKFEGKIDELIGNLKGLRSLNVSNNIFTGEIPSSLGNLTLLEALDLSQNKLSGEIPQQLAQLTFLSQFNAALNRLTGPIPQGNQFATFNSTSYEGNPGLCGDPLPTKCGNPTAHQLPPPTVQDAYSSESRIEWIFVVAGLGSGLVQGIILADLMIRRRYALFLKIVDMLVRTVKRRR